MTHNEKEQLVTFFSDQSRWCKEADARDRDGNSVHYDSAVAVAWDLVGAMCHLFGWARAGDLFVQIIREFKGLPRRPSCYQPPRMAAMTVLQDFNDHSTTTFGMVADRLNELRVCVRKRSRGATESAPELINT